MKGLRTALIEPFSRWFRVNDICAISNLLRIHKAGFEFSTVEEFQSFLKNNWPERKFEGKE